MKRYSTFLLASTALLFLASCNKFEETPAVPDKPNEGQLIQIFAENPSSTPSNKDTRANIEVDGNSFTGEWEENDILGLLPVKDGGNVPSEAYKFTYNVANGAFELPSGMDEFKAGTGNYYAFYPHAQIDGTTVNLPFGNVRKQTGSHYNSQYDALVATPKPYSESDTEPGKINGEPVKFKLNRLTSILKFTISNAPNNVKYLRLTSENSEQSLSAASLDFSLLNGSSETVATLNDTDKSNLILMEYTPEGAVEAYFNVPAGNYDNLTLDVITEDKQIGSVSVKRANPEKPFVAGTLYKKTAAPEFTAVTGPTLVWPGEDINAPHDITKCGTDYQAAIQINAPGSIAGLTVKITSDVLNYQGEDPDGEHLHLDKLDLFHDKSYIMGEDGELNYGDIGLKCAAEVQYKKSTIFDVTELVPLILALDPKAGSEHTFEITVSDLMGQSTTQKLVFKMPNAPSATYKDDADLWANTASFVINDVPEDQKENTTFEYRIKGEEKWNAVIPTINEDGTLTAKIEPKSTKSLNPNNFDIYTFDPKIGIFAKNIYEYQLKVDGSVLSPGEFTPKGFNGDEIPLFESASSCFTKKNETTLSWGSGNNTYASELCTYDKESGAAKMKAVKPLAVVKLAPGNLFTGTFKFNGALSGTGTVAFGQKTTYTARPTAIKLWYKSKIGTVTSEGSTTVIPVGNQDEASIVACIVDWNTRLETTAGKGSPKGVWNPVSKDGLTADKTIIAYGTKYISETVSDMTELIIPLNYYDIDAAAPTANYNLVISCSTSRYGDYLNGSKDNELYVKDFEWVY